MKKQIFDEHQRNIQRQICMQTLIFTLVLIILNGIISTFYVWGSHLTQSLVIVFFTLTYFSVKASIKGVYIENNQKHTKLYSLIYIGAAILVFIICIAILLNLGIVYYAENGILKEGILLPITSVHFLLVAISLLVKEHRDSNDSCKYSK